MFINGRFFPMILRSPDEGGGAGGGAPSGGETSSPSGGETSTASPDVSGSSSPVDSSLPPSNIFEALGEMDDDGPPELAPESPPTPSPTADPNAVAPPPQVPTAPPQAAQPQPTALQQPEPTQAPQPTGSPAASSASAPFSRETIAELENPANRDSLVASLAEQFVLTPEDLNGLATDAAPVLQRIAARILYANSVHMLKQFREFSEQHLPARFNELREATQRAEEHVGAFERMWPALRDPRYAEAINAAAAQAKKVPGITQDGVYRTVGRMVAAQYGLQLNPVETQAVNNGGGGSPVVMRQPVPFAPAAPSAASPHNGSQTNGAEAPFAGLGLDFD